jgi:hypothetical protein
MDSTEFKTVELLPVELNRDLSQDRLEPSQARILQNIDVLWAAGRMRRISGMARLGIEGSANGYFNSFVATRRDCKAILMTWDSGGNVLTFPGDGTSPCAGPMPLWNDYSPSAQQLADNGGTGPRMNEDIGTFEQGY